MKTSLLEADPDLARYLPPDSVRAMAGTLIAPVHDLPPGPWQPPLTSPGPGHLGFLLLSGMLIRRVIVDGSQSGELLLAGDIVRPWVEDPVSFCDTDWRVTEPVRLAELDRRIAVRLCSRPEISAALLDKQLQRSRSLAIGAATENVRGLDRRLLVLFWHLAERWGQRRNGVVIVPLQLTHETLSLLVGARRPSVTTALGDLAGRGLLRRLDSGHWVLSGAPPAAQPVAA